MLHEEVLQLLVGLFRQNTFSTHEKRPDLEDRNTAITQTTFLIHKNVVEKEQHHRPPSELPEEHH